MYEEIFLGKKLPQKRELLYKTSIILKCYTASRNIFSIFMYNQFIFKIIA